MGRDGRPRVLLLITHLEPGGAQETVVLLAEGLKDKGFDVAVGASPGSEQRRLEELSVEFHPLHMAREVSLRGDSRAFRDVWGLLRRARFDVVHTHSSKAGILGRVAAKFRRVPAIIHTSHGLPVNPDMGRLERAVLLTAERAASYFCDKVVAVSRATAAELQDLGIARAHQIEVIPSGVDLRKAEAAPGPDVARKTLDLDQEQPVLGWVGRHFAQKRPDHLVLAARRVLERVPDAAVVLAGDGPMLERTRVAAGDDHRIRILGHRTDIETVYAAMDVMLLTSAWEGLPRTVLEAQAVGKPVVSTDVSGIPEVVADGRSGYLARPGEWERLADAAARLLEDRTLRRRMSDYARKGISEFYSADHMVDATAEMYRRVLARSET